MVTVPVGENDARDGTFLGFEYGLQAWLVTRVPFAGVEEDSRGPVANKIRVRAL